MPIELVPFVNAQQSGLEELGGASPSAMNVVADRLGCIRRRPGITTTSVAPSTVVDSGGIFGLYAAQNGILFAVGARSPWANIYAVAGGAATSLSPGAGQQLAGTGRPTFAETEMLLVLAAGDFVQKVELASSTSSRLGGNPPRASHVIAHNLRLLLNDALVDRTKVNYSEIAIGTTSYAGHEQWPLSTPTAGGYVTAESRPDPVVALGENTNEVFVWGTKTLQVFTPDGTLRYAPVPSREVGCAAPHSVVKFGEGFAWLDGERRFVASDGRSTEAIGGDAIKKDLGAMSVVSDCFGYRVAIDHVDANVWTFPSDGRTYTYQQNVGWGQWQSRLAGAWGQFPVTAHHLETGTKKNLVGTADGRIGELSLSAQTDFGEPISADITTGFVDRGTSRQKVCNAVRLTLRRGEAAGEPTGLLSWRDNLGEWEAPIPISLGRSGDFQTVVTLFSLGVYRTRQWRFQFDGSATLVLVKAEEDFTVLEA